MIVYANGRLKGTNPKDGTTSNIETVGINANQLGVSDVDSKELLYQILSQLKIMNLHLSDITDNHFIEEDVEGL